MTDVVPAFVQSSIDRLRQLVQLDVIESWRVCETDCSIEELPLQNFGSIEPNEKRYLVWEKGRQVRWFYQEWHLPHLLQGYPVSELTLRLALTWWAEFAQVYVNGQLVQEGDLFDYSCRVVLSPNQSVSVAIRLVSPGHDIGGLMRSILIYESDYDQIDPGFVADELTVLTSYLAAFEPEKIETVSDAIAQIDWNKVSDRTLFDRALESVRHSLSIFSPILKKHTLFLLGHAHLDMAWLWDVEETWRAAERTFQSVLNLQKDFPELTFCHTTPALYEWIEKNRPEIFAQIVEHVKAGRWEIVGGMWVEPELNLINGESIARQILYGQRYCKEKFGAISRVAWLPDTFGFNWQLPQFLKQGGIDYFVTQKLRWNDTNQYPYEVFDWQAPDGSKVPSLMSAPIGEGIDPIKMSAYAWEWAARTGTTASLWLPGVGDHGGGPTRDMLEIARRWARSPFFPNLKFTTAIQYLEQLETRSLPVWNDEIYLEFHRGCYTTHGDQKKFSRECETRLYQAELLASLATLTTDNAYPKAELEAAWKKVLFNQFHDILPGSSITKVFVDANQEWKEADAICQEIRNASLDAIAQQVILPSSVKGAKSFLVFNSLNWIRSQLVTLTFSKTQHAAQTWLIFDAAGQPLETESKIFANGNREFYQVSFYAEAIPAIGYRCFWLYSEKEIEQRSIFTDTTEAFVLENDFLKVAVNPETGNLSSIFDKVQNREILREEGNQLQAFKDEGQYWDAWNIDPNYANFPLPPAKLLRITPPIKGKFETKIFVDRSLGQSTFYEMYRLEKNSSVLKISTCVDWCDRHIVVKAAFPLNIESDRVTSGIACGAINRPTQPQTAIDKAKWEFSGLGWTDLSGANQGVSLLSDCKYGFDSTPHQLRLTLLRGSEFPDPLADQGTHVFTSALYVHQKDWKTAQTARRSDELTQPLQVVYLSEDRPQGTLPPVASFLDLNCENLILSALKQSEDNPNEWILRCYECHGQAADLQLKNDLGLTIAEPVDLLEGSIEGNTQIQPWQVRSFRLKKRGAPKHTPPD